MNNSEKSALISELAQLGIKHSSEKIVRIAKQADGKIFFLEEGNADAGLQHILEEHSSQFADKGIEADQIPDAIITALTEGRIVGYQGRKKTRIIYEQDLRKISLKPSFLRSLRSFVVHYSVTCA
ncbi:MAG: hypothetical protein ACKPER_19620 [Dolichospermum sp.]